MGKELELSAKLRQYVDVARSQTPAERKRAAEGAIAKGNDIMLALVASIGVMDENGEDLSWLPPKTVRICLSIYQGKVIPEAFERFSATRIESKLHLLSHGEQKKLAAGEKVTVLEIKDGKEDTRLYDPMDLDVRHLNQVFGEDGIRTAQQQRSWLEAERLKSKPISPDAEIFINKKKKIWTIRVGEKRVDLTVDQALDFIKAVS